MKAAVINTRQTVSYTHLDVYKRQGEYEVPVSIEVPDGVELEKQPTIKVKLTEKEDETDQKADKKSDSTQEKSEK